MPAIWSSSERPISVREVWVDGVRHAILSPDDPFHEAKSRQHLQTFSSKSKNFPVKYVRRGESFQRPIENLDSCLVKFHVLASRLAVTKMSRRQSAPPISQPLDESRNLLNLLSSTGLLKISRNYENADDEKNQLSSSTMDKEFSSACQDHSIVKFDTPEQYRISNDFVRPAVQFDAQHDENYEEDEIYKKSLSERVFYWMDRSGRVKDYKCKIENQKTPRSDRRGSLGRSSECCILRESSVNIPRDLTTAHHYKLCANQADDESASPRRDPEKKKNEHTTEKHVKIASDIQQENHLHGETLVQSQIIFETTKSIHSPYGRLQLHIFMPDLHSNEEEDTFSQNSLTIEDTSECN